MAVNCQRCGTQVTVNEWFCSFCGKERPMCPDCGAEMDDEKCKNCGTPRQAPCGNCGLMINGTAKECPNCEYSEAEEIKKKSSGRKKKALALAGVGVLSFFVVGSVIPGPSIIGTAVGAIVGLPFISWGALVAFYYSRKESKSEQRNAAELSKGREQNKTKEWREMKQEQRKAMLNAAAEGISAAGEAAQAYGKKKEKEQKEKQLDERINQANQELTKAQQKQQEAAQEKQRAQNKQQQAEQRKQEIENSVADVPKACPRCKEKWRGSGGMLSSQNYEELAPGRFQCTECGETVNLG